MVGAARHRRIESDEMESPLLRNVDSDAVLAGRVSMREHFAILGNRLLHSQSYQMGYAVLTCLSAGAFLVVLTRSTYVGHPCMIIVDGIITGSLLVEVLLRVAMQGARRFWSDRANRYDSVVCAMCVFTFALFVGDDATMSGTAEQALALFMVGMRYVIQLMRLMVFVRSYKRRISASSDIKLLDDRAESPSLEPGDAFDIPQAFLGPRSLREDSPPPFERL